MNYDDLVKFVQEHFTDGLALVIGSGLSAAEGLPGMPALATHLSNGAGVLTGTDATLWNQIKAVLNAGEGLEAALLKSLSRNKCTIPRGRCSMLPLRWWTKGPSPGGSS